MTTKGFLQDKDLKFDFSKKVTKLNAHAAEFVPSTFKSTAGNNKFRDIESSKPGSSGKAVLGRSASSVSNSSDDEAQRYWCHQLPDDIIPDFSAMGHDEPNGHESLSVAGLSLIDGNETVGLSSETDQIVGMRQDMLPFVTDNISLSEKQGYSGFADQFTSFTNPAVWESQLVNSDQHLTYKKEGQQYNDDFSDNFMNSTANLAVVEDPAFNPLEFLASQFPGFSADSLRGVYDASGCDLYMTLEILTQLELQVDGGSNHNQNAKPSPAPNLNPLDFPVLPVGDAQNGLSKYSVDQASSAYRSPSLIKGTSDFASTVRKLASQDSGHWKYERNGSADGSIGTSRSSPVLASSCNGNKNAIYRDKLASAKGSTRSAPIWLETGAAVANMYAESREEARDFARVRNAYFDQARQAYLIGNKALAKELSTKGQLFNLQMKTAHVKARELIYRQRNPVSLDRHSYGCEDEHLIDLHGLHVNEALHVLKHELSNLRSASRLLGQRLQAMICVGTGHHTKGSRTPARLPVAVEQYLIEEGLRPTLLQPGLLRVTIY